jgi:diguanylate cyclase (GGDEF)-like protein
MSKAKNEKSSVLIIDSDDQRENLLVLEDILEEVDCHIIKTKSTKEALSQCLNHSFACIFLNAQMQNVNTYEIVNQIHKNQKTAHVPIVMLSASEPSEEELVKAYQSGAVDYMLKPVNPYVLRSKLRVFMRMDQQKEQLKTLLKELDSMAYFDPLTNLYNRRQLSDILEKTHLAARRYKRQYALLILDVDNFKNINDTLGHDAGDSVLKHLSGCLSKQTRGSDYIARLGGDEFAIILPEIKNTSEAGHFAKNLLRKFSEPFFFNKTKFVITASIGIACEPRENDTPEDAFKKADIALYKAKDQGKNGYQFFTDSLHHENERQMLLENELRHAIEKNELFLCFQPQVELNTGKPVGIEVLSRWNNPKLGNIPPDEFIAVSEEIGFIDELCFWVIETACKQYDEWAKQKKLPSDHFTLAINFSPVQFKDNKFFTHVLKIISQHKIPLNNIVFELTESVFSGQQDQLEEILHELSKKDISFSIDDFGTGYSSLSRLSRLPINALKIDKSFVQKVGNNKVNEAIITSTIGLSRSLKLEVIAEGVETEDQALFLMQNGCIFAQGYLYSKPLNAKEMAAYLETDMKHVERKKSNRRSGVGTLRNGPPDRRDDD